MCGIKTRGRGRKKCYEVVFEGDPKKTRHRKRNGRNRSKKRQNGVHAIMRGEKAALQATTPST